MAAPLAFPTDKDISYRMPLEGGRWYPFGKCLLDIPSWIFTMYGGWARAWGRSLNRSACAWNWGSAPGLALVEGNPEWSSQADGQVIKDLQAGVISSDLQGPSPAAVFGVPGQACSAARVISAWLSCQVNQPCQEHSCGWIGVVYPVTEEDGGSRRGCLKHCRIKVFHVNPKA